LLYLFVLAPWLALYEGVLAIGIPPDAIAGVLPFERHMQVLEWTQVFYGSTYLIALAAPLIANTRADLRQYAMRGLWTMAIAYPLFVLVPLISPKRAFVPHTVPGRLLAWEQSLDSSVAAFPSFHVIWSMLAAEVFARRWPRLRWCFYGWAALVAVSCVTTGQHSILDVVGGVATVVLVLHGRNVWLGAIGFAERISASLSATRSAMRLGPERFASAGFYLAAGIVLALCVAGTLPGASLRPGVPGVNPWLMPGALAASMPWVLAAGSLRRLAGRPVEFPLYSFTYRVAAAVVICGLAASFDRRGWFDPGGNRLICGSRMVSQSALPVSAMVGCRVRRWRCAGHRNGPQRHGTVAGVCAEGAAAGPGSQRGSCRCDRRAAGGRAILNPWPHRSKSK